MQRLQAFKYELMSNGQQERQMRRFAGSCRFVYNKALARMAAEGQSITIAPDWGFGTATVIDQDGFHTHIGHDDEDEQRALDAFVDGLHERMVVNSCCPCESHIKKPAS